MIKLLRRFQFWIRQRQIEAELAEEIEIHRAMKQEQLEQSGLHSGEAASASQRILGNITLAREDSREVWIWPWLESVWQDLAYAARNLRGQPVFTLTAVIVLAVAIGLNTSLFTVFNAIVLRPWPVKDPGRVVNVFAYGPKGISNVGGFSIAEYRYLDEHAKSFGGLVAMRRDSVSLGFEEVGERTGCLVVSANYLRVLGVEMEHGRSFIAEEDRFETPQPVTVLSYRLWKSRFGAEPGIIGKQVNLDDVPFTVVGVAARDFTGTRVGREDLWIPLSALAILRSNDPSIHRFLSKPQECCSAVAGRLAPGVSREQGRAELELLSHQFRSQFSLESNGILLTGTTFFANPTSKRAIVPVFALMFVGVTLILLLACANVSNLLIARAAARCREVAVRLSLGASRPRLIRQLLTESLMLATGASAIGILLAYQLPSLLLNRIGQSALLRVVPDASVLCYALGLGIVTCITFGLAPALYGTGCQITDALKEHARFPHTRLSLRSFLLSAQVAISIVLLIGAGLLLRGV